MKQKITKHFAVIADLGWQEKIIQEKDRKKAGKTLPPQGLYLVKVEYA